MALVGWFWRQNLRVMKYLPTSDTNFTYNGTYCNAAGKICSENACDKHNPLVPLGTYLGRGVGFKRPNLDYSN